MKPIKINESEKSEILNLHNKNLLKEEVTQNKTIADIQKLLGLKADNKLGPQTLAAIKTKLGQPSKTTTETPKSGELTTTKTDLPSDFGQIKPIEMPQMKVGALKTDGGKVTGVATSTVQSKPEEKTSDAVDSKNI